MNFFIYPLGRVTGFLLPVLWKETLLSLWIFPLILIGSLLFKKKNQLWRLGLWNLLLLRLILPPDLTHAYSADNIINKLFPPRQSPFLWVEEMTFPPSTQTANLTSQAKEPVMSQTHLLPIMNVLLLLWILGFISTASLLVFKRKQFIQLIKQATPVNNKKIILKCRIWKKYFKIRRSIQLVTGNDFPAPFTLGVLHPVIFIPKKHLRMNRQTIESILAHEMAHIKQRDDFWIILQNVIQSIYWFHPIVWLALNRIQMARECICDDMVLSFRKLSAENYGKGLLAVLQYNLGSRSFGLISSFGNPQQKLRLRIQNMKGDHWMKKYQHFWIVLVLIALGLFLLPVAGKTYQPSTEKWGPVNLSENPQDASDTLPIEKNDKSVTISFIKPVKNGKVLSGYGMRVHPITKKKQLHQGVDIPSAKGTPVMASADGSVIVAKSKLDESKNKGYGRYITIQHENRFISRYAQLDSVCVQVDQKVKQGEIIGFIGDSGYSTGTHLHFEIRKENKALDPEKLIDF